MRARRAARASLLLEVMLALALFVAAGGVVLGLVGQAVDSMRAVGDRQAAVDAARSAMAQIEAGIVAPELLQGPVRPWVEEGDEETSGAVRPARWELQVELAPSRFPGLTLVTVTAFPIGRVPDRAGSFTLRQLVRLFGTREEGVGEKDLMAQ